MKLKRLTPADSLNSGGFGAKMIAVIAGFPLMAKKIERSTRYGGGYFDSFEAGAGPSAAGG
jgi:hypothetical protein